MHRAQCRQLLSCPCSCCVFTPALVPQQPALMVKSVGGTGEAHGVAALRCSTARHCLRPVALQYCVLFLCRDLKNSMRCLAIGQFVQAMEHHRRGYRKLPNTNWLQEQLRRLETRLGFSASGHVSGSWLHTHLLHCRCCCWSLRLQCWSVRRCILAVVL